MRTANFGELLTSWRVLLAKCWGGAINFAEFKDLCKKGKISLNNGLLQAYEEVGVIQRPQRGLVMVTGSITVDKIVGAYALVKASKKQQSKQAIAIKEFNAQVEAKKTQVLTEDACRAFLKKKGYVVYLPKEGEKVQVIKSLN